MAERFDPNDLVTLDELALSTMWETSALVEGLERNSIPCAAGRAGDDPRAAPARVQGHPATATQQLRDPTRHCQGRSARHPPKRPVTLSEAPVPPLLTGYRLSFTLRRGLLYSGEPVMGDRRQYPS